MTRLTVGLLGGFAVCLDDEAVVDFGYDKVRALLIYLAVAPDRPHRRERLTGLLWPMSPKLMPAAISALLSTAYVLPSAIIVPIPLSCGSLATALRLNLDADMSVDVRTFSRPGGIGERHGHERPETCATCAEKLSRAAALYRATSCQASAPTALSSRAGWSCSGKRYTGRPWKSSNRLAAFHLVQGNYTEALACARRQLEMEPWQERAHRQVMEALALNGQRAMALRQYESCVETLDVELGIGPEEATEALFEAIRRGEVVASAPAPARATFRG